MVLPFKKLGSDGSEGATQRPSGRQTVKEGEEVAEKDRERLPSAARHLEQEEAHDDKRPQHEQ